MQRPATDAVNEQDEAIRGLGGGLGVKRFAAANGSQRGSRSVCNELRAAAEFRLLRFAQTAG